MLKRWILFLIRKDKYYFRFLPKDSVAARIIQETPPNSRQETIACVLISEDAY